MLALEFAVDGSQNGSPDLNELPLEIEIELAEHALLVAQANLAELLEKRDAEDAHIDAQFEAHLEIEAGKNVCSEIPY